MKSLFQYIQEKLVIKKRNNIFDYKYFPKTTEELEDLIKKRINKEGREANLNDIDVSKITDMSSLFSGLDFNGDISNWNVSGVENMSGMFFGCKDFNQDISDWDVSNVTDMRAMFYDCKSFNQNISSWDVSKVTNMASMFCNCGKFNQDISNWDVSNVTNMVSMFSGCKSFNQDISTWDVSKVKYFNISIFTACPIEEKYKPKFSV